jgi:hypothetical protein
VLNKLNDVREFRSHHLADIPHVVKVEPDPKRTSNGFEAHANIVTSFNRYEMAIYSSHLPPPAGAPPECASLGSIEFYDRVDDTRILGPRCDRVFIDVSRRIHHREFTDAIAVARRELAEAGPDIIKAAQAKLGALVSAAAKWGVTGSVPLAPPEAAKPAEAVPVAVEIEKASLAPSMPAIHVSAQPSLAPSDPNHLAPFVGAPAIFVANPGEQIAGVNELAAIIVRVHPDGVHVGLLIFIDDSETVHRVKIVRRGADAGNGRVHRSNCWDFNPVFLAERERVRRIEKTLDNLDDVVAENAKLAERIAVLEAKPKRGRPSKPEGGDTDGAELASELEPSAKELELTA